MTHNEKAKHLKDIGKAIQKIMAIDGITISDSEALSIEVNSYYIFPGEQIDIDLNLTLKDNTNNPFVLNNPVSKHFLNWADKTLKAEETYNVFELWKDFPASADERSFKEELINYFKLKEIKFFFDNIGLKETVCILKKGGSK